MRQTCRTCENVLCRFITPEDDWDMPNDCDKWRPNKLKKSVTKTELIRALHTVLAYCDNCYSYLCPKAEEKSECIFWDSCYYDATMVCVDLRGALEKLENDNTKTL